MPRPTRVRSLWATSLVLTAACSLDWNASSDRSPLSTGGPTDGGLDAEVVSDGGEAGVVDIRDGAVDAGDASDGEVPPEAGGPPECEAMQRESCTETEDGKSLVGLVAEVGACKLGTRSCDADGHWGPCVGAVGPVARDCDASQDLDCDGHPDNDSSRPDATCECWAGMSKACTGAAPSNCAGARACTDHHWTECQAPVDCSCTSGSKQDCAGGPHDCEGGEQTCTAGKWGPCEGAPMYCECEPSTTGACADVSGAPGCGTATCGDDGRWDTSACGAVNACGGCATLSGSLGSACDGSDADMCREGSLQCASGQLACSDTSASSQETCDGNDNDCDGTADNGSGMACVRNGSEACTYVNGACSVQGMRSCSSICQWGSCLPAEESQCNRKDDDCDGKPDEGLLAIGAPLPLVPFDGTQQGVQLAAAPKASLAAGGYMAVYWTYSEAQGGRLHGLRISAAGSPQGAALPIAAGYTIRSADVAWAGSHWLVAYVLQTTTASGYYVELRTAQVHPTTGAVTHAANPLSATEWSTATYLDHVIVTGGAVPMVLWDGSGAIKVASMGATPVVRTLLAFQADVAGQRVSYYGPRLTVVEDGQEWGVWAIRELMNNADTAMVAYDLRFVAFDEGLSVLRDRSITVTGSMPDDLTFEASSQRLVGSIFRDGLTYRVSHTRSGSDVRLAQGGRDEVLADTDGTYTGVTANGITRYATDDTQIEEYYASGEPFCSSQYFRCFDAVVTPELAANRLTVVGGYQGALRMFLVGCK